MTAGADNSLVNFIILAESVALAPIVDFCTSLVVLSLVEVDVFNLLLSESVWVLLLVRASFYIKQLWRSKIQIRDLDCLDMHSKTYKSVSASLYYICNH